jgi:hypothetical protein
MMDWTVKNFNKYMVEKPVTTTNTTTDMPVTKPMDATISIKTV